MVALLQSYGSKNRGSGPVCLFVTWDPSILHQADDNLEMIKWTRPADKRMCRISCKKTYMRDMSTTHRIAFTHFCLAQWQGINRYHGISDATDKVKHKLVCYTQVWLWLKVCITDFTKKCSNSLPSTSLYIVAHPWIYFVAHSHFPAASRIPYSNRIHISVFCWYVRYFICSHRQKSRGFRCGDLGGQCCGPPQMIHQWVK